MKRSNAQIVQLAIIAKKAINPAEGLKLHAKQPPKKSAAGQKGDQPSRGIETIAKMASLIPLHAKKAINPAEGLKQLTIAYCDDNHIAKKAINPAEGLKQT